MEETWKDLAGYEEYFEVSDLGNFRSKPRPLKAFGNTNSRTLVPKILTTRRVAAGGVLQQRLTYKGKVKFIVIKDAVARAFLEYDGEGQVKVLDGDESNVSAINLSLE